MSLAWDLPFLGLRDTDIEHSSWDSQPYMFKSSSR